MLSRVIPDEEQAVISAAGIKLISDILNESRSPVIQALAADCIARLAHTRAGTEHVHVYTYTCSRPIYDTDVHVYTRSRPIYDTDRLSPVGRRLFWSYYSY